MNPRLRREALDRSVLHEHTAGDRGLEADLLTLFEAQCLKLLPVIAEALDPRMRGEAAHTLRGGAAAVGAVEVVRLSAAIEEASGASMQRESTAGLVRELEGAIDAARSAIADWRNEA